MASPFLYVNESYFSPFQSFSVLFSPFQSFSVLFSTFSHTVFCLLIAIFARHKTSLYLSLTKRLCQYEPH